MNRRILLVAGSISFASSAAWGEAATGPTLFFDRANIPAIRERVKSPEYADVWAQILRRAREYGDPNSAAYADPANPYPRPPKSRHMKRSRYDKVLVHRIGRDLTKWMETLGFAYQIAGQPELGRHGAALLVATTRKYPATRPVIARGFAGGRGDIMRGLAMGYDLLGDVLTPEQRRAVAAVAAGYIDQFCREAEDPEVWWYRVHNYNGVNGGAAGCLALALRNVYPDRSREWIGRCIEVVSRWLSAGFDADGAYFEGILYSGYGLSNTVLFADALRRHGGPDLFAHPTFRKVPIYYAMSLLPGERVYDARNDSNYGGLGIPVLKLAEVLDSGLCRWLWDRTGSDGTFLRIVWHNTVAPLDPATAGVPPAMHFRGRGLCVWRTGWDRTDVMFSIEAGSYHPITHNQADKGHFTLYGLGHRWATDPGYANEHGVRGRGQTVGHSCVLVDGKGQARSGAGWGTDGAIVSYRNTERFGYALADCTPAYNTNNRGIAGAVVKHARRHAMFVYPFRNAPAYAVLFDDIRKDGKPHDYTWQMMFAKGMDVRATGNTAVFSPFASSGNAHIETPFTEEISDRTRNGKAVIPFRVSVPGKYLLWARVRTRVREHAKADSFFVRMDAAPRIAWHMPPYPSWAWARVTSGIEHKKTLFALKPGDHTLTIGTRETGAQMDCLFLTRDPEVAPELSPVRRHGIFLEAEKARFTPPMRRVDVEGPAGRLKLHLHADAPMTMETDVFRPEDEHGPASFPRFRAHARSMNPHFMAVLVPLPAGVGDPTVSFAADAAGRTVEISWPTHRDVITWPGDGNRAPVLRP